MIASQVIAARNMLRWRQEDLASRAKLPLLDIRQIETGMLAIEPRTEGRLHEAFGNVGMRLHDSAQTEIRLAWTAQQATDGLLPEHIIGARHLLRWSERELGRAARMSSIVIRNFEAGIVRRLSSDSASRLQRALESAGIVLLSQDELGACVIVRLPRTLTLAAAPGSHKSSSATEVLTPAQCRAARGLLQWSTYELANYAGLSRVAVSQFENGKTVAHKHTIDAILLVFRRAGVDVWRSDDGLELGVKIGL